MKKKTRSILNQTLNYLPGLAILIIGMVALQSSVLLMNQHEALFFEHMHVDISALQINQEKIEQAITIPHKRLYWSVIALGLCGFVLMVLNARKVKELSDATEEKRKALNLLNSRLQAMEASRDGICIVNANGQLTYLNTALMDLHGIPSEDKDKFLDKSWMSLYNEDGQRNITDNVLPDLQDKKFWRGEAPVRRHDDKVIEAELSLTLLGDGSIIGTARDISKRKKAEAEKNDLQKQFFQAQKMEAIGRLAGGIAHDFNNILAAMNGYAEFLSDDLEDGSPQHKFAANILKAGHQAKKLVDEILTFSRIKDDNFEDTDLPSLLRETLRIFDVTLPKTVSLKMDIPETPHLIVGNGDHVSQMAMNMCVNALDAIQGEKEDEKGRIFVSMSLADKEHYEKLGLNRKPENDSTEIIDITDAIDLKGHGDGKTRLVLGELKPDTSYNMFSVQDTGSGMTRETLEHVFEPFFTTKAVDKGTGLGMSMAHGVVQSHNAIMIIETKIGEGTVFSVLFPQSKTKTLSQNKTEEGKAEHIKLSGKVLLVEDQESVAQMTQLMLQRIGFEVTWCNNGTTALDELRETAYGYDLILTDQNMPNMTGLELVVEAKHDECTVPFVLVSGYSEKKLIPIMNDHPSIHAVLRKPIKQNDLATTLADVLNKAQSKAA